MVDTIFLLVSTSCYSKKLVPAADQFARTGQTTALVALLREAQQRMKTLPKHHPGLDFDVMQAHLHIVEGRTYYNPAADHKRPKRGTKTSTEDLKYYIDHQINEELFESICTVEIEPNRLGSLTLTRGPLLPHLYQNSEFLEKAFTGSLRGEPLALVPSSELLSKESIKELLEHLDRVPEPDDAAERRTLEESRKRLAARGGIFVTSQVSELFGPSSATLFKDLKQLLRYALSRPDLGVVQQIR